LGEGVKITPDMIPDVAKQPEVLKAAEEAGKTLAARLNGDHDREKVTANVQAKMDGRTAEMMEKMQHSV